MTSIEKIIGWAIIVILVLFVGSCAAFISITASCNGLQGIVDAIWTGVDCKAD